MFKLIMLVSAVLCSVGVNATEVRTINYPWGVPTLNYEGKTIGHPADISGPNGFKVGFDGNLYITSVFANEIVIMNPQTGEIIERIQDAEISGPDDIILFNDGSLYWTESGTGAVGWRMPNGQIRKQVVTPFVNPIAVNAQGSIFVAASFFGGGLYEIDPMLTRSPRVVIPDITELNGFEFGPDGYLYAPKLFSGEILRIDVGSGNVEVIATGFKTPSGIAFDSAGTLYVIDSTGGAISTVDIESGEVTLVAQQPGLWDNIAFDANDQLYASNLSDGNIFKLVGSDLQPISGKGLIAPGGLAVDAEGDIWVADSYALKRYSPSGALKETQYGTVDAAEAGYSAANTVAISANRLVVTSWAENKVQVREINSGAITAQYEDLEIPINSIFHRSILHSTQTNIGYGGVVRVPDRKEVLDWIILPTGLASDNSRLYVADWLLGSIWSRDRFGIRRLEAIGLQGPEGMAIAGDWLFVVEATANKLSAINRRTGINYKVVDFERLSQTPVTGTVPFGVFNGVAVNKNATKLYLSSDWRKTVYEFDLEMP